MLCERCNKKQATVFITKVINGEKQEVKLCDKCASESSDIKINFDMSMPGGFGIQNVISGIMDYLNQSPQPVRKEPSCKYCGTTYSEFKRKGLLGCSSCYDEFMEVLTPIIKRVQGNVEHVGKFPNKCGKEIMEKRKLSQLKEELQKAIALEQYERAAEIRDTLKELKKGE